VTRGAPAPDIAIIGGGIVGCATAAFLAAAGLRVRVHERSAIAVGASGRNSGIVQHPFDPVLAALYAASLDAYRDLAAEVPTFSIPDEPAGLLYVGRDADRAARVAADWSAAWPGARAEVVAGAGLRTLEPALAPDLVACRLAIGYPVAPAAATRAFADLARARGVELTLGDAARPAIEGDRVAGLEIRGAIEPAGGVVVAAGPWTPDVVDETGRWRPIGAVWGVVASVVLPSPPRHGLEAIDIDIEPGASGRDRADVTPRDDLVDFSLVPGSASSALGSTFLPAEPDPEAWIEPLRRVGSRYVPAIADAPITGVRHCARPVSFDGRPLVGPIGPIDRLWVAAGHGPWGISTGPGTARLLADRIIGALDDGSIPESLRADRFGPIPAR
jgi:glycine/D-amino acid oxidase-like deaminating enzyme